MSYTITITDPTPEEARKVITMLQTAIGDAVTLGELARAIKDAKSAVDAVAKASAPQVPEEVRASILPEPAALVVLPSVAKFAGSEIERLAEEQERDLKEEPTLSELSAAIQHDPSVFTASPQAPAGAPSFAAVAPAPTVPEVQPATLTAPSAPSVPAPPPAAQAAAPSTPATPSAVALDADGLPWDARIHSSSKEKVKAGTWKYRRGVDDAAIAQVEAELRQIMAIPAPAPAPVATPAPAPAIPAPPAPAALPAVVQAMAIITPLIAARKTDRPAVLAKLAEMGLNSPANFDARPDLLPEFKAWADSL